MSDDSFYVQVKAVPNSKKEEIIKESKNIYTIKVKEKPERNKANDRICFLLKSLYGAERVRIINGHHSTKKLLVIDK